VLLIESEHDDFIPMEARLSLRDALERSPAALESGTTPGGHLQPGSDALISKILANVNDWMKRGDLLLDSGRGPGSGRAEGPARRLFSEHPPGP
jgi:hypothetical protein